MKNHILPRSPIKILPVFGFMILAVLSISTGYDSTKVFFWGWLLVFIFSLISLFIYLLFPEMAIKNGEVRFFQFKRKYWRWVSLPISNIKEVRESERKAPGIGETLMVPTFIFIMKDGIKYEYFPVERHEKRLRKFLHF